MPDQPINCAMFPDPWRGQWHKYHPFLEHLALALQPHGFNVARTPEIPSWQWMLKARHEVQLIHLHWPEHIYQTGTKYRVGLGLIRFWRFLLQVRLLKYSLVWTCHEIYPHSVHYSPYPLWAHKYARQTLCHFTDAITVHCEAVAPLVMQEFSPNAAVSLVNLGSYEDFYPNTTTREAARVRLGLNSNNLMFLVFGTMRPNRNPLEVIEAFRQLDAPHARLFVIGQGNHEIRQQVEKTAWGDWRIRIFPYVVENEDVELYFKATDIVIMPGDGYTTSAVIMLALSYGKPVITKPSGCAQDMLGDAGLFYEKGNLIKSLQQALFTDCHVLSQRAKARSRCFTWEQTAEQLSAVYQNVLKN